MPPTAPPSPVRENSTSSVPRGVEEMRGFIVQRTMTMHTVTKYTLPPPPINRVVSAAPRDRSVWYVLQAVPWDTATDNMNAYHSGPSIPFDLLLV